MTPLTHLNERQPMTLHHPSLPAKPRESGRKPWDSRRTQSSEAKAGVVGSKPTGGSDCGFELRVYRSWSEPFELSGAGLTFNSPESPVLLCKRIGSWQPKPFVVPKICGQESNAGKASYVGPAAKSQRESGSIYSLMRLSADRLRENACISRVPLGRVHSSFVHALRERIGAA